MDNIIQTEILLNAINTVLAKALHFKKDEATKKLVALRNNIYHNDFNYEETLKQLKNIEKELN